MAVVHERSGPLAPSGCGVGAIPITDYRVGLRTFLAFHDVELDFIAFFERFVSVQLYRRVVDEYIRPVVTSDESVALGVIEPLNLSFVLSHRLLPSFWLDWLGVTVRKRIPPPIQSKTTFLSGRFSHYFRGKFIIWYENVG
jgi:hypothetical protein